MAPQQRKKKPKKWATFEEKILAVQGQQIVKEGKILKIQMK